VKISPPVEREDGGWANAPGICLFIDSSILNEGDDERVGDNQNINNDLSVSESDSHFNSQGHQAKSDVPDHSQDISELPSKEKENEIPLREPEVPNPPQNIPERQSEEVPNPPLDIPNPDHQPAPVINSVIFPATFIGPIAPTAG
jgi:hypothetical protein